jgi:phosphoribosylanthranilate isomerase
MRLFAPGAGRVKICGITTEADARMCVEAGADALGFNFYEKSSRHLSLAALDWIQGLEGVADRVAVVVNASSELLETLIRSGCFEAIQFHGDETPEQCATSGAASWMKAIRAKDRETLDSALLFETPHLLLDAWSPSAYGGTGETADWTMLRDFVSEFPEKKFVLAGGLTPRNVAEAIRAVRPAAVDVAGGVESSPGRKDAAKVRDFIQAARSAE